MSAIENPEPFVCDYGYDRCTEVSCFFNERFVPSQAYLGIGGIPLVKCPRHHDILNAAILDESIDIAERDWMKQIKENLEDENRLSPAKFIEFAKRVARKMNLPSASGVGVKDV